MNHFYAYYSNRMEGLYQFLKSQLFSCSHPLTKRTIVVPSPAMKSWLTLQMARDPDVGVAAGLEIGFIEPMLQKLVACLSVENGGKTGKSVPSQLEIALAIESVIIRLVSAPNIEHPDWLPLFQYLGVEPSGKKQLPKKVSRRIVSLASVLAPVFLNYGVYGEQMLDNWLVGKDSQWQQLLWDKLEKIFAWNHPISQLKSFNLQTDLSENDIQIHIFGVSFLPALYHRFLHVIAKQVPVHYYVLSPCQKFWGDLLSGREGVKLKKYWKGRDAVLSSQEALEEYLRDNNPLLANYGRLGRETSRQIDDGDPRTIEAYVLPETITRFAGYSELSTDELILEKTGRPLTLLEMVQSDIALLRNPEESEKIHLDTCDGTIQVHAAPKMMREVQVLYDTLMGIIDKHRGDPSPILPGDIFVMAQNISEYVPYIQSVFESAESQLPIQLLDHQIPMEYPLIRGFLHLLKLAAGRWEASALFQLFEFEAFRNRFQLSLDDIATIKQWIMKTAIYWGADHTHRTELMVRDYQVASVKVEAPQGTWENGFNRLLDGLAIAVGEGSNTLGMMDASQGPLLGKVIAIVRSLQDDLMPLSGNSTLTLREWSTYLKCLLEAYFSPMSENRPDEGFRVLSAHLDIFSSASAKLENDTYSFDSLYPHLEEHLQKETTIYRETSLQSIRFSSLLPMRAVPAKVVVLMGMQEGAFPRTEQASGLNLLLNNPTADYCPEAVDFDRYLFLEALLSARHYFVLSYISQEIGGTREIPPSLLVQELFDYIDKAAHISPDSPPSASCFFRHALDPFHFKYFSSDSRFKSYCRSHYLAAVSHYYPEKVAEHSFLTHFTPYKGASVQSSLERVVDLRELSAMAKNPLKFYLNKALGIYLTRESDRKIKDAEDLFLSDLQAAILLRESIANKKPVDAHLVEMRMPNSSFKPVGMEKYNREMAVLHKNLKDCGVDPNGIFSIEFNDRHHTPHFTDHSWYVPPLIIDCGVKGTVKVVGTLETVSSQGMIILAEDNFERAVAQWPSALVYACLVVKYSMQSPLRVIFLKGERPEMKELDFQHPEVLLGRYLDYYFESLDSPSPILTDWVLAILNGNVEKIRSEFENDLDNEYRHQFDEYTNWLERTSPRMLPEPIDHWQPVAKHLFQEMTLKWYPQKAKGMV